MNVAMVERRFESFMSSAVSVQGTIWKNNSSNASLPAMVISLFILINLSISMESDGSDPGIHEISMAIGPNDNVILINEVYPDPDRDINNDGEIDQEDEFIELYNPTSISIEIRNWTISDNVDDHRIVNGSIDPYSHLLLKRTETGLKLGSSDSLGLFDENGSKVDGFNYSTTRKGRSYQRIPDGASRWSYLDRPTPESDNPEPPKMVVNEILVDPKGVNRGNQWIELLNKGNTWNICDFSITNHDSVNLQLPSIELDGGARMIIHLGDEYNSFEIPPNISFLSLDIDETFYISGDDIELKDMDGYSLDHIAWGSSSHVDLPNGYGNNEWVGRYYDDTLGSMTGNGSMNPDVIEGRSLMRIPDGIDTNSPEDHGPGPLIAGSTKGWNNSLDPDMSITFSDEVLSMLEGGIANTTMTIELIGNLRSNISIDIDSDDENWTVIGSQVEFIGEHDNESYTQTLTMIAPDDIRISKECSIFISVYWDILPFIQFKGTLTAKIPFFDCGLEDISMELDGFASHIFPEGSMIGIEGYVLCSGSIDGGDTTLTATIEETDVNGSIITLVKHEVDLKGLKATSRRRVDLSLDTLGLEGDMIVRVKVDPDNRIREPDEENNERVFYIEIIPTVLDPSLSRLMITGVIWNTTREGAGVTIYNSGSEEIEISGMRLVDDSGFISFPEGSMIDALEECLIVWSGNAVERFDEDLTRYFACKEGPISSRMIDGSNRMDLPGSGSIILATRYRDLIDHVPFKREMVFAGAQKELASIFPETTFDTLLKRRTDISGTYIDTDSVLDWTVGPNSLVFGSLSIDPGPDGCGEFIGIRNKGPSKDISGIGIVRGSGMASIPNGTGIEPGTSAVLSMDPEAYRSMQGVDPSFSTSDQKGIWIDCSVPGYGSITLPNKGGDLVLVDSGNRVIDNVSWGSDGQFGSPERGVILEKCNEMDDEGYWKVKGIGDLPLGPFNVGSEGLGLIHSRDGFLDSLMEDRKVKVVMPGLTDEDLAYDLLFLREQGVSVDLFITNPPWERSSGIQVEITRIIEQGWLRHLSEEGINVHSLEGGMDDWGQGTIISARVVSTFPVDRVKADRNGHYTEKMICVSTSSMIGSELIDIMMTRITSSVWFDPYPFLKEVGPIVPEPSVRSGIDGIGVIEELSGSLSLEWSLEPTIGDHPIKELKIIHMKGPIDLSTIAHYLERGTSVDLVLAPAHNRVRDLTSEKTFLNEMDQLTKGSHLIGLEALVDDVNVRVSALMMISSINGWDLDVRTMDHDVSFNGLPDIWYWDNGMAFSVMNDMAEGVDCWISIKGMDEVPKVLDDLDKMSILAFPGSLIPPMGEEKDTLMESKGGYSILIDRVYYDTYLKDDPDESIRIMNVGDSTIDISNFIITDDEGVGSSSDGMISFPTGTILGPDSDIWIARDGGRFRFQFGFHADLVIYNSSVETMIPLAYGDIRMANSHDSISLRDEEGRIVDVVLYGDIIWDNIWMHYDGGVWNGDPANGSGWGKILHRTASWYQEYPIDTNSGSDWMSMRPFFPGQSWFERSDVISLSSVKGGICPYSGSEIIRDAISDSRDSIHINVYQMTSEWMVRALIGARERGVDVLVILEGGPVGGTSYSSEVLADRMTDRGIEVRWMKNDIANDIRDRYRFDHAKYLVLDGEKVIVSTDNFKDSSFPIDHSQIGSTRGWIVSLVSRELAASMDGLFMLDWNGPDMMINAVEEQHLSVELRSYITVSDPDKNSMGPRFGSSDEIQDAKAQLLLCPDHISTPENPLITSLKEAELSIDMELLDIDLDFSLTGHDSGNSVTSSWGIDHHGGPVPNPYLAEIYNAAGRGVYVKILLDGSDFNGDGQPDNGYVRNEIEKEADLRGIGDHLQVRLHPTPRKDPFGEISLIHNKGVIIDGSKVWISSFNWGPTSGLENREVGLLMESSELSSYFKKVFDHDWGGTLQNDLDMDLRYANFRTNENGTIRSRFSFDIEWRGNDNLNIWIKDMSEDILHPITEVHPDHKGNVIASVDIDFKNVTAHLMIIVSSNGRSMELTDLSLELNDHQEDGRSISLMGMTYVPIILIIILVMGISLLRAFIMDIKDSGFNRKKKCEKEE